MTASTFGWLDHDEGERRRMMEVVDLFREKGTLDELGIGAIRDTWAEHSFPGTSTIQSRARYFLFIPWLYGLLEHDRVPSNRADGHARKLQWRLVQSLRASGEGASKGVIGIEAGEHLQRLPTTAPPTATATAPTATALPVCTDPSRPGVGCACSTGTDNPCGDSTLLCCVTAANAAPGAPGAARRRRSAANRWGRVRPQRPHPASGSGARARRAWRARLMRDWSAARAR